MPEPMKIILVVVSIDIYTYLRAAHANCVYFSSPPQPLTTHKQCVLTKVVVGLSVDGFGSDMHC